MLLTKWPLCGLAALLLASSAFAQQSSGPVAPQQDSLRWGLGLGVVAQNQGYKGQGDQAMVVPIIYAETKRFYLMGPRAGWRFINNDTLRVSAIANYRFDGYDSDDSRALRGMSNRDGSLDAGMQVDYRTDWGNLSASAVTDTMDKSNGQEVRLKYGYPFSVGSGSLSPIVALSYQSEDLVDYYYGVTGREATADRPAYSPDGTTNLTLGLEGNWFFKRRHVVFLNAGYQWLGSEIEDSPIIKDNTGAQLILGWVYTF